MKKVIAIIFALLFCTKLGNFHCMSYDTGSNFMMNHAATIHNNSGYTDEGNLVTSNHRRGATEITIYSNTLEVEKSFSIPNGIYGGPVKSLMLKNNKPILASKHIFNSDDYYEFILLGGLVINEKGEIIGLCNYDKTKKYWAKSGTYDIHEGTDGQYYFLDNHVSKMNNCDVTIGETSIIARTFNALMRNSFWFGGNLYHHDFGYPSIVMKLESQGIDVLTIHSYYNHFLHDTEYRHDNLGEYDYQCAIWSFFQVL